MGTFTRDTMTSLYLPGLKALLTLQFAKLPWIYKEFCKEIKMDKRTETVVSLYGIDTIPQALEGAIHIYGDIHPGYTIAYTSLIYKYGLRATKEAVEDDLYGAVSNFPEYLSRASRNTIEIIGHTLINNAFATNLYDGVPLCSVSHPSIGGVLQANRPAADADLGVTSLKNAILNLKATKSWEGIPVVWNGGKLIYPIGSDATVFELIRTEKVPYKADNEKNYLFNSLELVPTPYMTDSNAWIIVPKGDRSEGLKFAWRVGVTPTTDLDPDNDDHRFKLRFRCVVFVDEFRHTYGSSGST